MAKTSHYGACESASRRTIAPTARIIPSYPLRLTAYVANGDALPREIALPLVGAAGAFLALLLLAVLP